MIYIGDLSAACAGVSKRLEQGGFFLFAVENMDQGDWEQTPMNRFRHSEIYLREQADRAGLDFVELMECTLRRERSEPVMGFAIALRKPFLQ
jgi:predicted TPR repeat methyltransferase